MRIRQIIAGPDAPTEAWDRTEEILVRHPAGASVQEIVAKIGPLARRHGIDIERWRPSRFPRLRLFLHQLFCRHHWARAEKEPVVIRRLIDGEDPRVEVGKVSIQKCMNCDQERSYFKPYGRRRRRIGMSEARLCLRNIG
jgi:hypothetical protein